MKTKASWKVSSKLYQAAAITGYTSAGALLAVFLVGFVPQVENTHLRRLVSKEVMELRPQDYPSPILHSEDGSSFRAPANKEFRHTDTGIESHLSKEQSTAWLQFTPHSILLNTMSGQHRLSGTAQALTSVLAADLYSWHDDTQLLTPQPLAYGEALAHNGSPLRWRHDQVKTVQDAAHFDPMCSLQRPTMEALQATLYARAYTPRRGESYVTMARRYKNIVASVAQRFKLRPSLIYSIIHTESNFRPRLVSSAAAMGLMQLLPTTAGGEVHKYLYGHTTTMTLEELSNPELNITFGATYFYLLMTRHLHGIHDARSREYCAIAAYNMGIGRLMRYFGGDQVAFANINALSSQEVYRLLTQILPIAETRAYVSRVSQREHFYRNM